MVFFANPFELYILNFHNSCKFLFIIAINTHWNFQGLFRINSWINCKAHNYTAFIFSIYDIVRNVLTRKADTNWSVNFAFHCLH